MKKQILYLFFGLFFTQNWAQLDLKIESDFIIQDQPIVLSFPFLEEELGILQVNGQVTEYSAEPNKIVFNYLPDKKENLRVEWADKVEDIEINPMPLFWSIVPPLLAILLAILLKEALVALFIGSLFGLMVLGYYQSGWMNVASAPLQVITAYLPNTLNFDRLCVVIFSMLAGGMTALISKNGGIRGVINKVTRFAKDATSTQFTAYFSGIAIFFDEYTNTLVVGNTMRSLFDKAKISREKLAYIVDSTASPITSIALVTTWIGVEISYITGAVDTINRDHSFSIVQNAYSIFLNSIPYAFYSFFTIFFIALLILLKREYGPMYHKEIEARKGKGYHGDEVEQAEENILYKPLKGTKLKAYNAIIPLIVLILGVPIGLLYTGEQALGILFDENLPLFERLSSVVGAADGYAAVLAASFSAILTAFILTLAQKIMSLQQTVDTVTGGMKFMFNSMLILIFAWFLSDITKMMHTADFLTQLIESNIPVKLLPATIFLLAIMVAFSTGTSWGTMGVLYPIIIPLVWKVAHQAGLEGEEAYALLYNGIAAVLTGAVFGDHCSPISDTTVLSSLASSCDHLSHVKTQIPYAVTVGFVSLFFGTIPAAFGVSNILLLFLGMAILTLIILTFGKKIPS